MGIRDTLKKREEKREAAQNGGPSDLPEGVKRYVSMGSYGEVNKDGRTFVILAEPDDWYFYFVHEHKTYANNKTVHFFRKHTCLHSPKGTRANIDDYNSPGKDACISCKAGAPRKLYAMIPVYDLEYKTYRVIDTAEFHVMNLIADYDKIEKTMKKATKNPDYSIVGEAVFIKQADKTYSLESGDCSDEELAEAKKFIGTDFDYVELANFREESDIIAILHDSDSDRVNKSVLPAKGNADATPINDEPISDDDLPF